MTERVRICALLAVCACCLGMGPVAAQGQTPGGGSPQNGSAPGTAAPGTAGQDEPALGQLPASPVDQQEQLIRQVDPLERAEEKKAREKAERDARKKANQDNLAIPGSIAESQQSAAQRSGPAVEDQDREAAVQEYTGPAVLSRSYSVNQSLVPEQIRWNETLGVSGVYDTGISRTFNADGSLGPATALTGALVSWSFSGRHYFRRDVVSVNYTGNYSQYSGNGAYSGSNQRISANYTHAITRRLRLSLDGSGSILSESSVLENQPVGPQTIANISLASSPNIQIFDVGSKQMSMQADLIWELTARLSFSAGTSYFGIERDSPLLLGVTGHQARGDVTYRLTRRTTVGAYYSFNHYLYPHGFGNSDTDTFGGIYSYAFNRTTQLRFRGGLSVVESLGLVTVAIPPALASLLGINEGIIDSYATYRTSDISAQFIKDFPHGRTASLAYARGISPGNGVYQTSQQETISGTLTARVLRSYTLTVGAGRDTLKAATLSVVENFGTYQSEYARLSLGRTYRRGVGASLTAEYRHFSLDTGGFLRNQLRITSGITWGSGTGKLWPF
jgi:hypothetical protein